MKLQAAIDSYVSLKQSLGASFRSEARILRSFARAMGDIELGDVRGASRAMRSRLVAAMAEQHKLGPFVRRFLLEELIADRNLSINTQRSYRDCIRLLLRFLADKHKIDPTRLTIEQVSPDVVREFLSDLEQARGNSTSSRNQRLAAIRSLFRFVGREVPELVDHAAQIRSIPPRRTTSATMAYLDKPEVDAVLAAPDRGRAQGRRDYALILFLYNTGARASEAATVNIGDLYLDNPPSARFLGKGRKVRHCPLWSHTVEVLRHLLGKRLDGPPEAAVFLNVRGKRITRFGAYLRHPRETDRVCSPETDHLGIGL